ncbi:hypothetical protein [Shinella sp.]|uniref:hypothetical protein n=1 Tax=Shinella sp. TaxID=1870904 RepID=UPI0039E51223
MPRESETAGMREGAGSFDRAECLEIMFAVTSQGLCNCPAWFVTAFEDRERRGRGLPDNGEDTAGKRE